jgi:hypothetical protein
MDAFFSEAAGSIGLAEVGIHPFSVNPQPEFFRDSSGIENCIAQLDGFRKAGIAPAFPKVEQRLFRD